MITLKNSSTTETRPSAAEEPMGAIVDFTIIGEAVLLFFFIEWKPSTFNDYV
jgi:hypothetical protein